MLIERPRILRDERLHRHRWRMQASFRTIEHSNTARKEWERGIIQIIQEGARLMIAGYEGSQKTSICISAPVLLSQGEDEN